MEEKIEEFLLYLKNTKKSSSNTCTSYKRDLYKAIDFFKNNGITSYDKITSTNINSYILFMEKQGKSPATIARNISALNTYFRYLLIQGVVKGDPTDLVKAPKVSKKIPEILTTDEIDKLLSQPNGNNSKAIRDKALLELLCSTGIRVSELINMKVDDVNVQLGYIVCKNDKKDRVIPFGNKVKIALSKYIYDSGNSEKNNNDRWLFLNCFGDKMSRQGVWKIIKEYAKKAGIMKEITPHMLRHSFGAHMINSGKDIKEVQEIMGHIDIASTSIYSNTKISE